MKLVKFSFFLLLFVLCANHSFAQKMSAADVLAKHLESIGSAKNRAAVKTRIIVSDVEFLQQKQNPIKGKALIASSTDGSMFGINLDANDYKLDTFSYDGQKLRVNWISPGVRSFLGSLLLSYPAPMKDSLMGGTLSSSWAMLYTDARKPKLSYEGTEKIDGKETHILEFQPKSGSELEIKLFFDAENFRHVRTTYSRVIGASMSGNINTSASQVDRRYKLVENFSDFKKFGDLTLPSSYKIDYTFAAGAQTTNYLWKFKVTDASFNQPLGDDPFNIDAK